LFNDGRILQKGTPKDLYENPKTRYAAEFLGRANFVGAETTADAAGRRAVRIGNLTVPIPAGSAENTAVCIRPEKWRIVAPDSGSALTGRIAKVGYFGYRTDLRVDTPAGAMTVIEISAADRRVGDLVGLQVEARDVKFVAAA